MEVTDSVKALLIVLWLYTCVEGYDVFTQLVQNEYWQVLFVELWDGPHYVKKPDDNQV